MRRFFMAAAALALAVALAGCAGAQKAGGGQGGSPTTAGNPLPAEPAALAQRINEQLQAKQTVHVEMRTTSTVGGKQSVQTVSGDMRTTPADRAAKLSMQAEGTTSTALLVGDTLYFRTEGQEVIPGKPWIRMSPQDLAAAKRELASLTRELESLGGQEMAGLSQLFDLLLQQMEQAMAQASSESIALPLKQGTFTKAPVRETVDGKEVWRYEGEVDFAKLPQGQALAALLQQAGQGAKADLTTPWTFWVEPSGLPYRFTLTVKLPQNGEGTVTATYTDWGKPMAPVTAPPAGQVVSLSEIFQGGTG